ncbi:hypothetical protein BAE44_0020948, partial [Dichanthelium oligosanthes]
ISALPDDALLPALGRRRADVPAPRRWRHLWKSTRVLCVTRREYRGRPGQRRTTPRGVWTTRALSSFVKHFLLLGGGSPVEELEISCGQLFCLDDYEGGDLFAAFWIRHALSVCHARVLRFSFRADRRLRLHDVLFVSKILTRVELADARLTLRSLDFSSCPALEDLKISSCQIHADRISSQSLTCLSITDCYFHGETRTRISTPRLVWLHLAICNDRVPFLEKMPLLVAANVRLEGLLHHILSFLPSYDAVRTCVLARRWRHL